MMIKLVGVSLEELEIALKYSGLFVDSDGDYAEIKQIPYMFQQKGTTLDMWEALGEAQDRAQRAEETVAKMQSILGGVR